MLERNNSMLRMYGIWIPRTGWWKLPTQDGEPRAYADVDQSVVERYAAWVGEGARVEVIDRTLELGEAELLKCEAKALEVAKKQPRKWKVILRSK